MSETKPLTMTAERTINALRKRNAELEADCDIKAHHYKMQALLAEELQKQLDRALERIAKLEAQDRKSERLCKEIAIKLGATLGDRDRALSELAEVRKALELVISECFTNLDCNHQEQDSHICPEECEDIDDCIGCTIVQLCQNALAARAAIPGEPEK